MLRVSDPVSVTYQTAPLVVKEGDQAVLKCKSLGKPQASVEWMFDGEKLGKLFFFLIKLKKETFTISLQKKMESLTSLTVESS